MTFEVCVRAGQSHGCNTPTPPPTHPPACPRARPPTRPPHSRHPHHRLTHLTSPSLLIGRCSQDRWNGVSVVLRRGRGVFPLASEGDAGGSPRSVGASGAPRSRSTLTLTNTATALSQTLRRQAVNHRNISRCVLVSMPTVVGPLVTALEKKKTNLDIRITLYYNQN